MRWLGVINNIARAGFTSGGNKGASIGNGVAKGGQGDTEDANASDEGKGNGGEGCHDSLMIDWLVGWLVVCL
jgi:hypothetical protein